MHKSIAVIGGGISGLSAAWLLAARHRVTLIEREARLGGHSHTVEVATGDGTIAVDTGFIVYNPPSYPNLVALFDHLGVPTAPTSMTFSVSLDAGGYEYSGSGLAGVFGQPSNLANVEHWRMLADILRFFRSARELALSGGDGTESLGAFLARGRYSEAFVERHILPMGAAIWSTPTAEMLQFPALAFARFFANHGLLQARNRPQWRTVVGGSREYVRRLIARPGLEIDRGSGAVRIVRRPDAVEVTLADGRVFAFDDVVIACHADEALALLADATGPERELLGAFRYARNEAVLHRDPAHMPRRRRLWSSWNVIGGGPADRVSVTYWMNRLQPLPTREDLFVSLNPARRLPADLIERSFVYTHPMLDGRAVAAQPRLWSLQGRRRTWYAGSYFGSGFHEDGLQAGLAVAEALGGVRRPWRVAGESARIHIASTPPPDVTTAAA